MPSDTQSTYYNAAPDHTQNNSKVGYEKSFNMLREAGLRLTWQRMQLIELLYGVGHRHVTVDMLYREALESGAKLSLSTVYNTMHRLCSVNLLREISLGNGKSYFDTDTCDHQHYFMEESGELLDIPCSRIFPALPTPPQGTAIKQVDVVVRLQSAE
ncbi:MAG: transcriptional repressor [Alphaproteobacteria bacterium]|nr:transcriptional repressor [Alphaproteobacteria bacterium]